MLFLTLFLSFLHVYKVPGRLTHSRWIKEDGYCYPSYPSPALAAFLSPGCSVVLWLKLFSPAQWVLVVEGSTLCLSFLCTWHPSTQSCWLSVKPFSSTLVHSFYYLISTHHSAVVVLDSILKKNYIFYLVTPFSFCPVGVFPSGKTARLSLFSSAHLVHGRDTLYCLQPNLFFFFCLPSNQPPPFKGWLSQLTWPLKLTDGGSPCL